MPLPTCLGETGRQKKECRTKRKESLGAWERYLPSCPLPSFLLCLWVPCSMPWDTTSVDPVTWALALCFLVGLAHGTHEEGGREGGIERGLGVYLPLPLHALPQFWKVLCLWLEFLVVGSRKSISSLFPSGLGEVTAPVLLLLHHSSLFLSVLPATLQIAFITLSSRVNLWICQCDPHLSTLIAQRTFAFLHELTKAIACILESFGVLSSSATLWRGNRVEVTIAHLSVSSCTFLIIHAYAFLWFSPGTCEPG